MDYIGYYVINNNFIDLTEHIEFWADLYQYSSQTTLLFWVPQHTIAAWLLIGMTIYCLEDQRMVIFMPLAAVVTLFWSPFGVIGCMPFLIYSFGRFFTQGNCSTKSASDLFLPFVTALWVGFLIISYRASNTFRFPISLTATEFKTFEDFLSSLVGFLLIEFALLAGLVLVYVYLQTRYSRHEGAFTVRQSRDHQGQRNPNKKLFVGRTQRATFWIAIVFLLLLPLLKVGINNDLVMRASIPALFIFWSILAKVMIETFFPRIFPLQVLYILIVILLLVGSFTPLSEIYRSVVSYTLGPPPISSVQDRQIKEKRMQRVGSDDAFFYEYLSR
jgi:hypothetical protein